MLKRIRIDDPAELFKAPGDRKEKGVYFYRINGYNETISKLIKDYYEAASSAGVVLQERIPNPGENELAYFTEIMGMSFRLTPGFITASLKTWLPGMNAYQLNMVAASLYNCMEALRRTGKNEAILKNAYIKFMCWLYYRFARIVMQLGSDDIPKILYEAEISQYELLFLSMLSNAGCDVILLQYNGDAGYLKLDPQSRLSDELRLEKMTGFPRNYSLKTVQKELEEAADRERLCGTSPLLTNCTNTWSKGKNVLEAVETPAAMRGSDPRVFCNCFCRVNGVEDKLTYISKLYRFRTELAAGKRRVVITDGGIPIPSVEEINAVKRSDAYRTPEQLLTDIANNIVCAEGNALQALIRKTFLDVLRAESEAPGMNLSRLTGRAVYLVCWIRRYAPLLFANWKMPEISCFIHFGACKSENEAALMKIFGRLPVDTLILVPDLNEKCVLTDPLLYEQNFAESMHVPEFPKEGAGLQAGTSAYYAERELDTLLYQDTGLYRNQQYAKADAVTLKTMYEEIQLLWKEEVKYRPNFGTGNGKVSIPVIFSKVSGVKDGNINAYWNSIRELMKAEEVFLITDTPYIDPAAQNPMKEFSAEFLRNGKLQRSRIKEHKRYPYGFLREEMQEHILDKLQLLIDQRIIKGTFENGTEYTIVTTVLNLGRDLVRLLQRFDFTKKNPKLIWINTGEKILSSEDSILSAFLNLAGFDILFFVPTGYQSIEKHFNKRSFEEHQIGEYVYDLQIPDLRSPPNGPGAWLSFFRRG